MKIGDTVKWDKGSAPGWVGKVKKINGISAVVDWGASKENVPLCSLTIIKRANVRKRCPIGGDNNNCWSCEYSIQFLFNEKTGDCEAITSNLDKDGLTLALKRKGV